MQAKFANTDKDFAFRIELLKALGIKPGVHRILDYGCSWGYGTWQFQQAGFEAVGFEISSPRAEYGRQYLGVSIVDTLEAISDRVDVFFSAHVIEHLSSPAISLRDAKSLLRPNGLFAAFTPNGCFDRLRLAPARYHRSWGGVHPSYLDDRYWLSALGTCPKLLASNPYDLNAIAKWDQQSDARLSLIGDELLVAARLGV